MEHHGLANWLDVAAVQHGYHILVHLPAVPVQYIYTLCTIWLSHSGSSLSCTCTYYIYTLCTIWLSHSGSSPSCTCAIHIYFMYNMFITFWFISQLYLYILHIYFMYTGNVCNAHVHQYRGWNFSVDYP